MTSSDVREILELENEENVVTKESLFNQDKKKKSKKLDTSLKRPEGMHRELWGLLWTDSRAGESPPIFPTDTNMSGYKQMKAKIGRSRVRPWKWMSFTNPARKDGAVFHHWRRVADEGKDYPFARFNKTVDIPVYSDMEYQQHLHDDSWSRQETDHLFELAKRFDLRFIVIHDRWDKERFPNRSVEDLKERYYNICNILIKVRAPTGAEPKIRVFDAEHERHRKSQLIKLFDRTQEQVEEEQHLITELKKIEMRKKEREKKTMDLQKLIMAADTNMESRRADRKASKKKLLPTQKNRDGSMKTTPDTTGIKFADFKASGVSLRSQRMKLPASLGQKKLKAIEQVLDELGLELNPIPSEENVVHFNELRQDIVLLYELKLALANCEYELQTLRHRFETIAPGKIPDLGSALANALLSTSAASNYLQSPEIKQEVSPGKGERRLSETIDVVGTPTSLTPSTSSASGLLPGLTVTPNRKRRAAIEQGNIMKKVIKQKSSSATATPTTSAPSTPTPNV